jgi:dTDP-4-amino-4,6-dideoxygalactose transaminase
VIVPQLDLATEYRRLRREIDAAMQAVCRKGAFIDGEENAALEHELGEYIGAA